MSVTLLLDEDSQTLHQSMTFTELLTEAKKLRPPDQIRLAAELLQCINVQGFQASLLPPHPLQNLTSQEYEQKLNETFQDLQDMREDRELMAIFQEIERERRQDYGRNFPEWEQ